MPKTLFDKIWDRHLVRQRGDDEMLLYVDHNVVHEGPFHAFDRLHRAGRVVRRPAQTFAFADHYVPSLVPANGAPVFDPGAERMIAQLGANAARAGIKHFGMTHSQQGIMHVVAPEIGLVQPGMVITGSDSHTTTNGAFGAFAIGVGAAQIEHVLATQTVWYRKPKQMRVRISGVLGRGVSAKDLTLALIAQLGIDGAAGHVVEYAGDAVTALSMEGRMTLCNMSIEFGAQAGAIKPDAVTMDYLDGREYSPSGAAWLAAQARWLELNLQARSRTRPALRTRIEPVARRPRWRIWAFSRG
jgi:3-isopropylmalate/(R)-2-methylmalate dehydratase large subunit